MHILTRLIVILILFIVCTPYCYSEELRILCWEGYAPGTHTKKFEQFITKRYDIDLKVVVTDVSDPEEFFEEIRAKRVDLISPAHNIPKSHRWNFIREKLVLPINLENIPNYQHIIPALKKADYITQDDKTYGVPIVYGPYGLAYNTSLVKKEPKSWNIFWEKKYAGAYIISSDYHEANIYITALALGFNKEQIFDFEFLRKNEKFQYHLKILAHNAKSFWVGVDKADQLQGLTLATAWGFSFHELKKRGEVWKFSQPKEGVTGWVDNWMIGCSLENNRKMIRIAEEWINYSIGPEMQVGYVRNIGQFPVNLSIKDRLTPEEIKNYHLNDSNYFKDNLILWKILTRREQNGFQYLWKNARRK